MDDLTHKIEAYLLERRKWVSETELCEQFNIRPRRLRAVYKRPNPMHEFAISIPGLGYLHIDCATSRNFIHAKHHVWRQILPRFRTLRTWERRRHNSTRTIAHPPLVFERDSGQAVFASIAQPHTTPDVESAL